MIKKSILATIVIFLFIKIHAQEKWFTKSGKITFDATAPKSPDNIKASNSTVVCVLNTTNGSLQFSLLMQAFVFEKALMQEHFNENYIESAKYPKATFTGFITNLNNIKLNTNGSYNAIIKGTLTLHGVNKDIETTAKITVENNQLNCIANFTVTISDYNISIPKLVSNNIAKQANINVLVSLKPFTK
jgi:polyisoprenoid-binding protein YceI